MERRRGHSKRPATNEELECWSHAAKSLSVLSNLCMASSAQDAVGRVNRLILAWPNDETLPAEGMDSVKTVYKKLSSGLSEIKTNSEREIKAMDDAVEQIGVLIALRKASESTPPEKRYKRPRIHSPPPTSTPPTPAIASSTRGASIPVQTRGSVGPQSTIPFSREPKARREALNAQLPLQVGRVVAFHPPAKNDVANGDSDDTTWILARVTRCINQDKNRYEVQDIEPQDDGQPGQCYNTTLRAIIPLPDLEASPSNAAHLNAYREFPVGSTVMALYPDTSCFYRAEVIGARFQAKGEIPAYKLKFEDDDDLEQTVHAQYVVEWPGA
ncbi:hypothetical protein HETIRDRAFT_384414 [Heterobasidion irregulare TC 32-1]|uniref:SGF29 C-terminal domain-containing protein n=1 Tax=Heterobasidion irregulare (strain TC 32-1) TaxID=747525 RepID=W4K7W5_HETIT|nr:uncharacterized protein HETIRDRAFT_475444 [Heterobasidion irregulare TC 32-1]XP_009546549.1 uncharacterized protein HETIRDRAFT_384414 [Heterobasidion irregulare TC 32-1]ETW81917.1 hypothetical protein HETIRDRAFT_475444 [Heterobasidion irregulare TC 32-1]ETW81959.1 hypothetical protein HETIRDRAFT_384414 [Heterobasidion irregulare TC 32-1]